MKLKILNNKTEIVTETVRILTNRIANNRKEYFVLGLSTGATILNICEELVRSVHKNNISLKSVVVFLAGEYVGHSKEKRHHYSDLLFQEFFQKVDIPLQNIYTLDGTSDNYDDECKKFEESINKFGGMDLFIGSLGTAGELAFNEPGSSLKSKTRLKTLTSETIKADARFFNNDLSQVPQQALTMGLNTIFEAKEIIVVVYGSNKAFVVKNALEKSISEMQPASILQLHENTRFFVDKVAGRLLTLSINTYTDHV